MVEIRCVIIQALDGSHASPLPPPSAVADLIYWGQRDTEGKIWLEEKSNSCPGLKLWLIFVSRTGIQRGESLRIHSENERGDRRDE